jgi:hypothetical protein
MTFQFSCTHRIAFAAEITVNCDLYKFAVQDASLAIGGVRVCRKRSRVGAHVDITVPTGIPAISAISL